ncbi:hypothetical protein SAMN04488005_1502 [Yoonia tamlensis]|uniref:Uncharacterized protein n=1 Tax=Yoonia tamlensis TaxID=390270 RepID=A0A1I6GE37_9RHOB|nr:hypothetical protein [Yoonia tamlensis]SFR40455.1 hypothetical protein SAMN04488005_1502 [Yoonia tamlensis]
MPSTPIVNFDAGRIPDVADETNFHADATYVFEHMASDIIPGINANLDWMNAALAGAETLVDAVADLQELLGDAPVTDDTDPDGGDFDTGALIESGNHTITGDWVNGPLASGASTGYSATVQVVKRAYSGGASITQIVSISGSAVEIYTRTGTGDPLVFTDWVAQVHAETKAQSANLTAFLAALTLPTADSDEDKVLATDGAGGISFRRANVYDEFTFDHAIDGAASTVEFLDLGDYRFIEYDITVDTNADGGFDIQVSHNNGTSWRTTGYVGGIVDGVSSSSVTGSFGVIRTSSDYASGSGRLFNFNDAAQYTAHSSIAGSDSSRTSSAGGRYDTKEAHDAIRFVFPGTSQNGNITVRGYR